MKKRIISFIAAVSLSFAASNTFAALADDMTVRGDVNADGRFTIADAVTFHKWLLAVPNAELANWKAADFNDDGTIDIFDFCLLRHELIEKYGLESNTDNRTGSKANRKTSFHYDLSCYSNAASNGYSDYCSSTDNSCSAYIN